MDINSLPSNSHTQQTTERVPKPSVVNAQVIPETKKSFGQKFKQAFFNNDGVNTGDYIIKQIIVPTVKGSLFAAAIGAVGALFWGANAPRNTFGNFGYNPNPWANMIRSPIYANPTTFTNYGGMAYVNPNQNTQNVMPAKTSGPVGPTDILLHSMAEAELVKDSLSEILATYHVVTLGDFYETCGVPVNGQTDYNIGWTDLSRLKIKQGYGGFIIDLPRPMPIAR